MKNDEYHEPVMVREAVEALHLENQARYIDATIGTAGHAVEIVKSGGFVLGIEEDPLILKVAKERLEKACLAMNRMVDGCFKIAYGNFRNIDQIVKQKSLGKFSGILFDLGVSNIQLKNKERGFSFENPDASLDMRIDPEVQKVKAADLLNALREDQLKELFSATMKPFFARRLAKRVVQRRSYRLFTKVGDLLGLTKSISSKPNLNPATLPFLALRIAVNSELENLREALPKAFKLLEKKGRLVIISFHSGEDTIVKDFFKEAEELGEAKILTEKPVQPNKDEVFRNPRSRSAKMRVLEKI